MGRKAPSDKVNLNMGICEQCHEQFGNGWTLDEKHVWIKQKVVRCPPRAGRKAGFMSYAVGDLVRINMGAPEWCPFLMEHLLKAERDAQ